MTGQEISLLFKKVHDVSKPKSYGSAKLSQYLLDRCCIQGADILLASNLGNTSGRSRTRIAHTLGSVIENSFWETYSDSELRVLIQSKDTDAKIGAPWDGLNLLGLLNVRMKGVLGRIRKSLYNSKGLPRVDNDR